MNDRPRRTRQYTYSRMAILATPLLLATIPVNHAFVVPQQALPIATAGRSYKAISLIPRSVSMNGENDTVSIVKEGQQQICTPIVSSGNPSNSIIPTNGSTQELNLQQVENAVLALSTRRAVLFGMLLALCSGFVNGSCMSGIWSFVQPTAAVTGTWTNSAIALAQQQSSKFIIYSKYLLSFIAGSTIGGLLMPRPIPFTICAPRGVASGFGLSSILLFMTGLFANAAGFGNTNFLCLCMMANGIQNSLTSSLTSNLCRTSHFSGISSDMGTFLGQVLRGNRDNLQKLKVFPLLSISFWSGGFLSYPLTKLWGSKSLLLIAGIYGAMAATLGFHAWNKACDEECLII